MFDVHREIRLTTKSITSITEFWLECCLALVLPAFEGTNAQQANKFPCLQASSNSLGFTSNAEKDNLGGELEASKILLNNFCIHQDNTDISTSKTEVYIQVFGCITDKWAIGNKFLHLTLDVFI